MYRSVFALILSASCAVAAGQDCSVAGKAYDSGGRPMRTAVVRLTNLQTQQVSLSATDANAAFSFSGLAPADRQGYRLDVLSPPTVVTGSHIPTRSVLGIAQDFACNAARAEHQDVHAQVD